MPPNVCQTYRHCRMQACGPASQFDWAGRVKMGSVDTRWSLSLTGQHRYLNAIESGYRVCCNRGARLLAIVNGYSITVRHEGSSYTLTDVALVRWFFREVGEALREMDRAQQEG